MARFNASTIISAALTSAIFGGMGTGLRMPAQAQLISPDEQLSVSMMLLPGESYEAFVERAAIEAARQIDNYFARTGADQVLLTLNGSNAGQVAPVLEVSISREEWVAFPQADYWATYFPDSEVLLGLSEPAPQPNPAVTEADPDESDEGEEVAEDATEDAEVETPSTTVITTPASSGDSITPDDVEDDQPVEPETSITTPESEVAPFEPTPDDADFEDTNDFEFVPEDGPEDLTDENGAIEPQTGIDAPTEGDVQVIQEPD